MRTQLSHLGALVVAGLLGATLAGSAAAQPPPTLRDGVWTGSMVAGASVDFSDAGTLVTANGSGTGTFTFDLVSGVPTGSYRFDGAGTSQLDAAGATGTATVVIGIDGTVEGTSEAPILQPASAAAQATGSVSVSGVEVPFDLPLTFGPDELTSSTLQVVAASCTFASGTWAQELRAAVEAAGGTVTNFTGSWSAQLQVAGPVDADRFDDLLTRGEALLAAFVGGGSFDDLAFGELLRDAELFAASSARASDCTGTSDEWSSPVAGLVYRLLQAVAASPSTSVTTMLAAVGAGLRSGVLPGDAGLDVELEARTTQLLDAAAAGGDLATIVLVEVVADMMGWTDLGAAAAAAFEAAS